MNETVELCRQINLLYRKAGKLNLYVSFCARKGTMDAKKLKDEIRAIKSLVLVIEREMGEQ